MGLGHTGRRGLGSSSKRGSRSCVLALLLAGLNPIEEAFSKIKQLVRKVGAAGARR